MSSAPTTANRHSENKHPSRLPRKKIDTLTYVDLGLENGGFPINVSEGGMAFHGIRPMQKDQLIHVKFKLPGLSDSVESAAQIAWLNDWEKGGGLRFIDLPEGDRHLIKQWLALQTPFRGLVDNAPIPHKPGAMKNFKPFPDVRMANNEDHSSARNRFEGGCGATRFVLSPCFGDESNRGSQDIGGSCLISG